MNNNNEKMSTELESLCGEPTVVDKWDPDFSNTQVYILDVITNGKCTITKVYKNPIPEDGTADLIYLIEDEFYITKVDIFMDDDFTYSSDSVSAANGDPEDYEVYEKCLKYIKALKEKAAETEKIYGGM